MRIFNQWGGVALLLASSMAASAAAPSSVTINLYAGNPKNDAANKVVGTVTITSGSPGSIVFNITKSGYCLTGYHIYVGSQPPGTSAPGQYPYKKSLGCVTNHTVSPPINIPVGYYVAVHGEVNYGCEASPIPSSPVPMCSTGFRGTAADGTPKLEDAYVNELRLNPGGSPADYNAWCVSTTITLPGSPANIFDCQTPYYQGHLYSSLVTPSGGWASLLGGWANPNWPAINYILGKIGTPGYMVPGNYAACDIQHAIWALEGYNEEVNACLPYDASKTNSLVAEALKNAPASGCIPGQKAGVVVVPKKDGITYQPLVFPTGCKCKDDTIWAIPGLLGSSAYSFVGFKTGWGGYFLMP